MDGQKNANELFKPHDISKTIEHAMHVFQGRHDALPDLLRDAGVILTRATKRFTPKQLVLTIGGVALAAILVITFTEGKDGESGNYSSDNYND
jgi:hypothetical protein